MTGLEFISLLGSLASLIGLPIAIWQLRKTQAAAEAAQLAAQQAVESVRRREVANSAGEAVRCLQELRLLVRGEQWWRAYDRCERLRVLLTELRIGMQGLDPTVGRRLRLAQPDLALILEQIAMAEVPEEAFHSMSRLEEAIIYGRTLLEREEEGGDVRRALPLGRSHDHKNG